MQVTDLSIAGTQSTPEIRADAAAGVLSLAGDSYPENAFELFGPVIDWVERYLAAGDAPLRLDLRLLYLNTSSIRAVMDIFDLLEEAFTHQRKVSVDWFYDHRNERVRELAEEFAEDCTFPFRILPDEEAAG
ncbi:MAG: biofilm regulation phosphoprotein SiaC [Xanthomonadales bacterium]|nr:biofilm regulation phosphoprotein SiaC [Xanthomonadales bacterium]